MVVLTLSSRVVLLQRFAGSQEAKIRGRILKALLDVSIVGDDEARLRRESAMTDHPTLHQWAGGDGAFRRWLDAFYDRVEQDELLSHFFPGGVSEEHRANVTRWWIEVFGGAPTYTETLGGYEAMVAHHRDLAITPAERLRSRP